MAQTMVEVVMMVEEAMLVLAVALEVAAVSMAGRSEAGIQAGVQRLEEPVQGDQFLHRELRHDP